MAVSPTLAEDLTRQVRDLYENAEYDLLGRLARALAEDLDSPHWAELKRHAIGPLRNAVERVANQLQDDATAATAQALIEAYGRGRDAAIEDLGAVDVRLERAARRAPASAQAATAGLRDTVAQRTRPLHRRLRQSITHAYQRTIHRAAGSSQAGRRGVVQQVLNAVAGRGITGFIDPRGRAWSMASYAEMTVRSVTGRAAVDAGIDVLTDVGVGLVTVSDTALQCPLCAPWEGEILALDGPAGPRTVRQPDLLGLGATVPVHIAGTLLEARSAGLFHPHCGHSLGPYFPGVTTRPLHFGHPTATYADTQRQSGLERQLRGWRRREAVALDDRAREVAARRVAAYSEELGALARRTGLARRPERES